MDLDGINLESLGSLFVLYGLNILYAIGLLVAGWWIATFVERLVLRALDATRRVDATVASFLANLARYAILVFVGVAVLQRFGIQTTSIIAVLGATSLAIGLALQGTLANLAAGVMLLLFRPFKLGDDVEVAGVAGTVKGLSLFTTELASDINVQVLIPNAKVWGSNIVNNSTYGQRQLALKLELAPTTDIELAMEEVLAVLQADERVFKDPAPSVAASKLLFDRVEITVLGWSRAADSDAIKAEVIRRLRAKLKAAEAPAAGPAAAAPAIPEPAASGPVA